MMLLTIIASMAASLMTAPEATPAGYWQLETTMMGAPATMAVKLVEAKDKYTAVFYSAMGDRVDASSVTRTGDSFTIVAVIHGGMEMTLQLEFKGDTVKGKWMATGADGAITGKRAPDPEAKK